MRTIEDLEHFVLGEGETLILRCRKALNEDQLRHVRSTIERALPGRPVMVLPPEMDVLAGRIEVYGADAGKDERSTPTQEDIDAAKREIKDAYCEGRSVWANDGTGWFYVHRTANAHTFDFDKFRYSLTPPKGSR